MRVPTSMARRRRCDKGEQEKGGTSIIDIVLRLVRRTRIQTSADEYDLGKDLVRLTVKVTARGWGWGGRPRSHVSSREIPGARPKERAESIATASACESSLPKDWGRESCFFSGEESVGGRRRPHSLLLRHQHAARSVRQTGGQPRHTGSV